MLVKIGMFLLGCFVGSTVTIVGLALVWVSDDRNR